MTHTVEYDYQSHSISIKFWVDGKLVEEQVGQLEDSLSQTDVENLIQSWSDCDTEDVRELLDMYHTGYRGVLH